MKMALPCVVLFVLFCTGCGGGGGVSGVGPNSSNLGIRVPIARNEVRVQLPAAGSVRTSPRLRKQSVRWSSHLPTVQSYEVDCMVNGVSVSRVSGQPGDTVVVLAPDGQSTILVRGFDSIGMLVARGEEQINLTSGVQPDPVTVEVNWVGTPVTITIVPPPAILTGNLLFTQTGQLTDGQILGFAPTFDFIAGQRYLVQLDGTPDTVDFDLFVQAPGLGALDWQHAFAAGASGRADETVEFTPTTTGRYDIFIESWVGAGSFTLRVSQP